MTGCGIQNDITQAVVDGAVRPDPVEAHIGKAPALLPPPVEMQTLRLHTGSLLVSLVMMMMMMMMLMMMVLVVVVVVVVMR
jgi:hypothetical protein